MLDVPEQNASQALLRADTALYSAKAQGKATARLFSTTMERQRWRRLTIEHELRQPHLQSEIHLLYQPIFDLRTGQVRSYEALARWNHGELGEVPPSEFILIAEQIGVIEVISAQLLRRAIQEAISWPADVTLSFNLSAAELTSTTLAHRILSELRRQGLDPRRLQVEVTETVLLVDFETARANLAKLQSQGVGIVLDDFGAGYASISYLQEIQFDCVKLDGGLLVRAARSPRSLKLLHGVIDLCRSLGVPCVAEHIESLDQLEVLRSSTCEKGQGYLLSRPLSAVAAQSNTPSQVLEKLNVEAWQSRAA